MTANHEIPNHIAIIMDGNGRWATKKNQPRIFGHRQGVQAIRSITQYASQIGVKVLSIYAFSTENWNRPNNEVDFLMRLPVTFFKDYLQELMSIDVKITLMGELDRLPEKTRNVIKESIQKTKHNQGMILNIALNYSGQQEIIRAINQWANHSNNELLTSDEFERYLYTAHLGEYQYPDLLIRTSGEERLSNFMLWQIAYSELYFTDILWPDFTPKDLDAAIQSYQTRDRRFGNI